MSLFKVVSLKIIILIAQQILFQESVLKLPHFWIVISALILLKILFIILRLLLML